MPVIDADALAREVVAAGTEGLSEIRAAFGDAILDPTGALDRKALARVVFSDAAERKKLHAITHPRIGARMIERAAELGRRGEPIVCYEAALIVENGVAEAFRPLVVCVCPVDVQATRLRAREGWGAEDALARIQAQMPLADKVKAADYVVDTSGSLEDTARATDEVLRSLCQRLGINVARYPIA